MKIIAVGISPFTSFTVDRGNFSDEVASNPQGATRMRGLSGDWIVSGQPTRDPLTARLRSVVSR